eukprot:2888033-Ditylum_brightwellii.AAC.1
MRQSSPKACDMPEIGSPELYWSNFPVTKAPLSFLIFFFSSKASVVLPVPEYPEIITTSFVCCSDCIMRFQQE